MLDNVSHQPPKFLTKDWIEINDKSRGIYSVNRQINFKTPMITSMSKFYGLCDYSNAYNLVKGNILVNNTAAIPAAPYNRNEKK